MQAVIKEHTNKAGIIRKNRDFTKCLKVLPSAETLITNPLMIKNTSTPKSPKCAIERN
ncbi:hypothetical protein PUR_46860 [Paenibacillus sp. URB8-2]|nr:hypothetical protein PUR_46860 [Paenibacillus sp. URB8-2]